MKYDDYMTDSIQIQKSEYDTILRQAVAVIDKAIATIATTVCSAVDTAHWKIESKHGNGVVNRLSNDLK